MTATEDGPARDLLAFIDVSPTPYHAVAEVAQRLARAGFVELRESDTWRLEPGARFFVVRSGSSIAAFVLGERPVYEAGFALIGAHTDSPNLRLKPQPDVHAYGYYQLAVEPYGSALLHTWLDRDLSLAGRVVVDEGGPVGRTRLVDFRRPLLRIPNLAIHLNRTVNADGLKLNAQSHMVPVAGLLGEGAAAEPQLETWLAAELESNGVQCRAEQIQAFDLCLYDVQPATFAGVRNELVLAPRLDNLASCHAALGALCAAPPGRPQTRGIVLYDHEEVGSQSAQGAGSPFLRDVLERIADALSGRAPDALARALASSLLISADMAHGLHPNYPEKHEPGHRPILGKGPVLKSNVSQAYASDAETSARFQKLCQQVGVTPQHFVSRSDLACGSTIGPITAGRVGLRTVDVGNPLLSMHSIREMAAVSDVAAMQRVLSAFFA
ncbi:MAG: M18 family aminopeptidase [Polyangiales bacterium]